MVVKKTVKKLSENPSGALILSERLLGRAGFLLNKAAQRIRDLYEEGLKPLGIIGKHAGVLMVLQEKGSISQNEIGKCVYIDRTSMVSVIDDLEKLGLVERKEHPTDRRSHIIYMTAKGKEFLPGAEQLTAEVEKKFLACLSGKEQKDMLRILKKLVLNHYVEVKG